MIQIQLLSRRQWRVGWTVRHVSAIREYLLVAAHATAPYWNGVVTHGMPQMSSFAFRRPEAL